MKKVTAERYFDALWNDGKKKFDDLSSDEQRCLAGLIMRDFTICEQWEFIGEPRNSNTTIHSLINYLVSFDLQETDCGNFTENKKNLAVTLLEEITANASDYARNFINEMFQQKIDKERRYDSYADHYRYDPEHIYGTDYRR